MRHHIALLVTAMLAACQHVEVPPDLPEVTAAIIAEQFAQRNCPRTLNQLQILYNARDAFDISTTVSVASRELVMFVRSQTNTICGIDLGS